MKQLDKTDRAGWSVAEWGTRYGLSRAAAYKIVKEGNGPRITTIPGTTKRIVTLEADAEYRSRLNAITAA